MQIRALVEKVYTAAQVPFLKKLEQRTLEDLCRRHGSATNEPLSDHGFVGTKRYKDESEERYNLVCAKLIQLQISSS